MEIPSVFEAAKRSRKEGDVSSSIYFASCPAFTTLLKENEMPNQFIVLVSVFLYTLKSRFETIFPVFCKFFQLHI